MKVVCKKCGGLGIAGTKCRYCSKMIPEPVIENYEYHIVPVEEAEEDIEIDVEDVEDVEEDIE